MDVLWVQTRSGPHHLLIIGTDCRFKVTWKKDVLTNQSYGLMWTNQLWLCCEKNTRTSKKQQHSYNSCHQNESIARNHLIMMNQRRRVGSRGLNTWSLIRFCSDLAEIIVICFLYQTDHIARSVHTKVLGLEITSKRYHQKNDSEMDHQNIEDAVGHFLTVCCHCSVLDFWNLKTKWMQIKYRAYPKKGPKCKTQQHWRTKTEELTQSLENTCLNIVSRKDCWRTGETIKAIKKDLKPHTDWTPPPYSVWLILPWVYVN